MWTCRVCKAQVDQDDFDVCWNCSSPRDIPDRDIQAARRRIAEEDDAAIEEEQSRPWDQPPPPPAQARPKVAQRLRCIRCAGYMRFHATIVPVVGGSLYFTERGEPLNQFYCPQCGKVEFFLNRVQGAPEPE